MTRKPGTIAAGAVLIAAVLGGTFGAALASGPSSEPAPRDVGIGYRSTTSDAPASGPSPSTAPVQEAPRALQDGEPCSTPLGPGRWSAAENECWADALTPSGPREVVVEVDESPAQSAARAEKAAKRAETAADRAEDAATAEPAPAVVPAAPAPECDEGERKGIPSNPIEGRTGGWKECVDGKWVVTVEPRDEPTSTPAPDYGPKPTPSA